jgi:hypothetical protein
VLAVQQPQGLWGAFSAAWAVLVLALKPVVKLAPDVELEAPAPDVVYYREGKRDNLRTRIAADTFNRFLAGNSVKVDEVDLNALRLTALESTGSFYKINAPSFRLRDDQLQIGVGVNLHVYGYPVTTLVQTTGLDSVPHATSASWLGTVHSEAKDGGVRAPAHVPLAHMPAHAATRSSPPASARRDSIVMGAFRGSTRVVVRSLSQACVARRRSETRLGEFFDRNFEAALT